MKNKKLKFSDFLIGCIPYIILALICWGIYKGAQYLIDLLWKI